MTLGEAEKRLSEELTILYDRFEAKNLAFLVISYVCKVNRSQYILKKNEELTGDQETRVLQILNELKTGKPLQYITGETEFYGLRFKVGRSVLIPRPETEELVEWALKEAKSLGLEAKNSDEKRLLKVLDIGTGSGCIAIAIKKNLPGTLVFAMDNSAAAIETARINAELNEAEINFIQGDVLNFKFAPIGHKFDLIISNPPYVTGSEKDLMHQNVFDHEPHEALFVPNDDPLLFYKVITGFAKLNLKHGGLLFFEINENFGTEITQLINQNGFKEIEVRKDMRGKDRMIKALYQPEL